MKTRKLTCLLCGLQGYNLVAMQEHVVTHGYELEDHRRVIRRAVENGFVWTMPDGVDWLRAETEVAP